jgi:hypothetical protein
VIGNVHDFINIRHNQHDQRCGTTQISLLFSQCSPHHFGRSGARLPEVEGLWFELVRNVSYFTFSRFRSNLTWAILGKSDVLIFDAED